MVINKDGLITENQNTIDNIKVENTILSNTIDYTNKTMQNENFDLKSNNQIIANSIDEEAPQNNEGLGHISVTLDEKKILEKLDLPTSSNLKQIFENSDATTTSEKEFESSDKITTSEENFESSDKITTSEENFESSDVTTTSEEKATVETNCLALTVRKDYNFAIAKNTVFKTIRMSIKVAISTFVLNLIKLFF